MASDCRSVISNSIKLKKAEDIVVTHGKRIDSRLEMSFNRYAAREFLRDPNSSIGKSLMQQMVEQFELDKSKLIKFNKLGVPWHVELRHEGATDAGGPGRDSFTDVCYEIMHPSLGLFIPSPNMTANHGTIRDLLIPNPESFPSGSFREKMFFYAGVVLSVCYISRMQAPFQFARFVWGALSGTLPTIDDIYEIDEDFHLLMTSIQDSHELEWSDSFHYLFEIKDSLGRVVPLFPGGSQVEVTFERRLEFVERAQKFRLKEFGAQLDALKRGFNQFFAPSIAVLFAPWEIELLCCGDNDCTVDEMKKVITSDSGQDLQRLWRILDQLSPAERKMFIKFGTGRGGLPPPGLQWQNKLQIFFKSSTRPDMARELPTAETCFSKVYIPRYDSDRVYLMKLRVAMETSVGIEDHAPEWRDLRAFT
jgi:hypothetical protein